MSDPIFNEALDKLKVSVGRAGLHALFPNDFEYYMCALELTDSQDRVVDYFVFPITPSNINYSSTFITNVKKTAGGVGVLKNSTYVPVDVTLSGTFGRGSKILVGAQKFNMKTFHISLAGGVWSRMGINKQFNPKLPSFSTGVKTGYGATKILEAICDKSVGLDPDGKPFRLYLYNPCFNANHLVEVKNITVSQSPENNMMWNYNLSLRTIAPINQLAARGVGSLTTLLAFDTLEKSINSVAAVALDSIGL